MWLVTCLTCCILGSTTFRLQPVNKQKHLVGKAEVLAMVWHCLHHVPVWTSFTPPLPHISTPLCSCVTYIWQETNNCTPYIHSLSNANSPQPITSEAGTPTPLGTRSRTLGKLFNFSMCRSVTEREVDPPTHSAVGRKGMWVGAKDVSSSRVRASYHCPS